MKKRIILLCAVAILIISNTGFATVWTETFDRGLGRFTNTTGFGANKYVWNESEGTIDAESVRYPHESPSVDMRYADIGGVYDVHSNILGFSAVVTPTNYTWTFYGKSLNIGFLGDISYLANMISVEFQNRQTSTVSVHRKFEFAINYSDGTRLKGGEYLDYAWGTTYFINVLVDGINHIASASLYEGTSEGGLYVGTISQALDPTKELNVYGLGLINGDGVTISQSYPYKTWGKLDEISLTSVPEPTTLSLFALGALALLRRRKA